MVEYNKRLSFGFQVVAFGICLLGSLTGSHEMGGRSISTCLANKPRVSLLEQRRISKSKRNAVGLQVAAAICFGTICMWTTRIALLMSVHLEHPQTGEEANIDFRRGIEAVCAVVPSALVFGALWVAVLDPFFGTSSDNRSQMLGTDIKKMSLKRVQKGGMYLIMFKALTSRPYYILLGGTIMATGLLVSEWVGVTSLDVGAKLFVNAPSVILSVFSALLTCVILIWLLFRVLQWKPHIEFFRVGASVAFAALTVKTMLISIISSHYEFDSDMHVANAEDLRDSFAYPALGAAVAFCAFALYLNIYDLRTVITNYRKDVDKLYRRLRPLFEKDDNGDISLKISRMSQSRTVAMAGANKRMATQVTYDAARFEAALLECCRVLHAYTTSQSMRSKSDSLSTRASAVPSEGLRGNRGPSKAEAAKPLTGKPGLPPVRAGSFHRNRTAKVAPMAELTENDEEHASSPTMTVPRSHSPRAFESSTKSVASVAFTGRRVSQASSVSQALSASSNDMALLQSGAPLMTCVLVGAEEGLQAGEQVVMVRASSLLKGIRLAAVTSIGSTSALSETGTLQTILTAKQHTTEDQGRVIGISLATHVTGVGGTPIKSKDEPTSGRRSSRGFGNTQELPILSATLTKSLQEALKPLTTEDGFILRTTTTMRRTQTQELKSAPGPPPEELLPSDPGGDAATDGATDNGNMQLLIAQNLMRFIADDSFPPPTEEEEEPVPAKAPSRKGSAGTADARRPSVPPKPEAGHEEQPVAGGMDVKEPTKGEASEAHADATGEQQHQYEVEVVIARTEADGKSKQGEENVEVVVALSEEKPKGRGQDDDTERVLMAHPEALAKQAQEEEEVVVEEEGKPIIVQTLRGDRVKRAEPPVFGGGVEGDRDMEQGEVVRMNRTGGASEMGARAHKPAGGNTPPRRKSA